MLTQLMPLILPDILAAAIYDLHAVTHAAYAASVSPPHKILFCRYAVAMPCRQRDSLYIRHDFAATRYAAAADA